MAKKEKPTLGPDDLVRATAGSYRSGDGRFEVQKADQGWFIVDSQQANEFGQQLIHGPFGTLDDVRAAIPGSREIKPLLLSRARPASGKAAKKAEPKKPAPPKSWIDKLPRQEALEVRALIRALEREGVAKAEAIVRRDRAGLAPQIATELLQRRLAAAVDELPEKERPIARKVIRLLGTVISSSEKLPEPLPGWAVLETGPGREPTNRRLRIAD